MSPDLLKGKMKKKTNSSQSSAKSVDVKKLKSSIDDAELKKIIATASTAFL